MLKIGLLRDNYGNMLKILDEEMHSNTKYIISFEGLYLKEYSTPKSIEEIETHENNKLIDSDLECIKIKITKGAPSIIERWFKNTKPMTMKEIVELARQQYIIKEYCYPTDICIISAQEED